MWMEKDPGRARPEAESPRATMLRFADYLAKQEAALTEQWLLVVRRDPQIAAADRLTHQQLVDHLPELYRELCDFLRKRDAGALAEDVKSDAEQHGEFRWRNGYHVDELAREIEAFRGIAVAAVARFANEDAAFRGAVEATARALVHQFFAEVSVNSVKQYADEKAAVLQAYAGKLEAANVQLGRANAGLKQAMAERQRLTTVVAHELRNFLEGLAHSARIWEQGAHDTVRSQASAQIHEMQDLVTQLLEHSELISSQRAPSRDAFDPRILHAEIAALYRPLAARKGLAFLGESGRAPVEVVGDRSLMRQIVTNLLANAVRYTNEGQVSLVFAAHDEQRWLIRIEDTGPGLTARATGRLFSELSADAQPLPSRGIGLGITRDLIDILGGSLQVVTQAAAGTRIDVLLPLRPTAGNPREQSMGLSDSDPMGR
jgi:signal transduction histidine kinase